MNPEEITEIVEPGAQLLDLARRLVAEVHPTTAPDLVITLDSSFDRDLGLDSLTRVELLARVEKLFNVSLPEQVIATAETPRDLLRALVVASPAPRSGGSPGGGKTGAVAGEVAVPGAALTLVEVLQYHAEKHPDRVHIRFYSDEDDGEVITYGNLLAEAELLAAGLQARGLAAGESVLIMLPTGRDYFITFYGVLLAGGVPVPVYPPGRMKQIEEHLKRHAAIAANCLAKIMVTIPEARSFARLMHQRVSSLGTVATPQEVSAAGRGRLLRLPSLGGGETAFLQYTSGSTGLPKGVVLSHANLLANVRAMGRTIGVHGGDVFVSWLPLYHDMGLIGAWLGSLYHGCPLVIMAPLTFLARPVRWLRAISRYRGTLAAAPNFAYELCVRRIDDQELSGLDLSSWRCAFNGAEAVSAATIEAFSQRFGAWGFRPSSMMPVYGLAESSVGLAFPPLGRGPRIDRLDRRLLMTAGRAIPAGPGASEPLDLPSCGLPLAGHQIRIVDADGRELPDRQQGQVQFLGPSATAGYFRNPAQTAALFHGQWLNSGDLGYIGEGELFITGRSKDLIIKGGRNIYPVELEEAVGAIEGVRAGNVAVFGSLAPDRGTERLIVLAESRKLKGEALAGLRAEINVVVSDLTGSAPDEVVLAPPNTVLKTSSGKIRRQANRELYESGGVGKPRRAVWRQVAGFVLAGWRTWSGNFFRRLGSLAFAGYCWLLFGLAAPCSVLGVLLLPKLAWRWRCNRFLVRLVFRLAGLQLASEGLEQLPVRGTPCILAANHASYLDGIILAGVLPRPFGFVAKAELLGNPWLRLLLPRLGTEFVERFDQARGVTDSQKLVGVVAAGHSLVFFPEGTLTRMPGLLPFRLGAFEIAVKAGLPVVPLAIRGSRSVLRAGSWFPRRGTVKVVIGRPLEVEKHEAGGAPDSWSATLRLRDQVRASLLALCGEPDLAHERPVPALQERVG